jgi:hypothetical protein
MNFRLAQMSKQMKNLGRMNFRLKPDEQADGKVGRMISDSTE